MQYDLSRSNTFKLTATGLLIGIGIAIPMFSPFRFVIEPASYTLASHVVLFLAMFISPVVAIAVALGTTLGFFLGGFPLVVVFRAASHVIFVTLGSLYLSRVNKLEFGGVRMRVFSLIIALIHGFSEFAVVMIFYFAEPGASMSGVFRRGGLFFTFFLLVGIGSVVHSLIDFEIAAAIKKVLERQPNFRELMLNKKIE